MTTLHDRLTDLATDAPAGPAAPGLWDRAVGLRRRRRVGTLVIAGLCSLLVAAVGLADWESSRTAAPATVTGQPLAIPDRFEKPSRWLPGTGGDPFGPLIAVIAADRGSWSGSDPGWVGVSAATGEYRFLDLPGAAADAIALSPDGRLVGYWTTGATPGASGDPGRSGGPVTGFAVFDVESGEPLLAEDVGATHGLMPMGLAWIDEGTLAVSYSRLRAPDPERGVSGKPQAIELIDVESGTSSSWPGQDRVDAGGGGWAVEWGDPSVLRETNGRVARVKGESGVPPVVDPTGQMVAGLLPVPKRDGSTQLTPAPVGVAHLGPGGSKSFERIPGLDRYYDILGWRDDHTLLVEGDMSADRESRSILAVDIRSGSTDHLTSIEVPTHFAQALLDLPTTDRPAPPRPWDPRIALGLVITVVLAGGGAALVWRRRVRP